MIQITWHGHSCFTVEAEDYTIVFDPYAPDSVPGLAPLELTADKVLCSHDHADHGCTYVVEAPVYSDCPFEIEEIPTFHDPEEGTLRGENVIHVLSCDGMRVAHFGDLGCELTDEQKDLLRGLDVAMIPVGGHFTIDAKEAKALIDELRPRITIPMHYRGEGFGHPVISPLSEFTDLCDMVVEYDTDTIAVDKEGEEQVAVLSLSPEAVTGV